MCIIWVMVWISRDVVCILGVGIDVVCVFSGLVEYALMEKLL